MELKEALYVVLAFLFPLWVYCLFLAALNRRPHPVVVAGPWDFVGVVLALSGFLLVGGPAILSNLAATLHGPPGGENETLWWFLRQVLFGALLTVYFLVLVVVIGVALWRRRGVTSVYNIDPDVFDEVIGQVFDQLGFGWARAGSRFYLRVPEPVAGPKETEAARPEPTTAIETEPRSGPLPPLPEPGPGTTAVIEVEPFPPLHHVSVRWNLGGRSVRQEVEGELTRALAAVRTRYNPAGGWFLSAAAGLFLLMFFVLLFLLVAKVLFRL
jgi:hypothetical protein